MKNNARNKETKMTISQLCKALLQELIPGADHNKFYSSGIWSGEMRCRHYLNFTHASYRDDPTFTDEQLHAAAAKVPGLNIEILRWECADIICVTRAVVTK